VGRPPLSSLLPHGAAAMDTSAVRRVGRPPNSSAISGVAFPTGQSTSMYPQSNEIQGTGVEAVLSIIEKVGGKRPFWPSERAILTQMREWSPLEDLQKVHAALMEHKEALLRKYVSFTNNLLQRCLVTCGVHPSVIISV
jgi:hypothetical protein